ncbi:hypothetical protein MGALJ_10010 [Mycobacterium gallinarum]|uniref:Uncharacterized protein n=1 Tax=Mycobacterium gallinarum TaxID=39689 RepID=A0A9W4FDR5_9MYCO|nr:hypothetical protein [Mycobacterium gallinarum]BBY91332.1 hypothetical protein MGALJ_10010 [Mycobacterium gallinarum]
MDDIDLTVPLDGHRELSAAEQMMLDDLRWVWGRLQQFGPELSEARREFNDILEPWTATPHMYSDGTVVTRVVEPSHHLYAPPHRRGTERDSNDD